MLVKDILTGPGDSLAMSSIVFLGSSVLITADDGQHGMELWRSNGTAAGTKMLKDINTQP